ncbi:hypothetical protein STEG23_016064, partial [Scotinomys teguina]
SPILVTSNVASTEIKLEQVGSQKQLIHKHLIERDKGSGALDLVGLGGLTLTSSSVTLSMDTVDG